MAQVELVIVVGQNRLGGDLVVNGLHLRRVIPQDREDLQFLVRRLQMEYGPDICIHLKVTAMRHMDEALVLAQRLGRLGASVGLSGCRGIALNTSCGYNDGGEALPRRAPNTPAKKRDLCEFSLSKTMSIPRPT